MTEIELLKRDALILANARSLINGRRVMTNHELIKHLFGLGSTTANDRCAQLGLSPNGNKTPYQEMLDHIKQQQEAKQ